MKPSNWIKTLAASAAASVLLAPVAVAKELKVGSYEPESHYLVEFVYKPYLKEITRRTNGELTFKWFHGGTLVKAPQTVEGLKSGLVDLVVTTGIFTQESLFPTTHVMTLPFQFDSTVEANHVFQKMYHEIPEVQAEFEGLVPLGFHVSDFFNLHIHKDVEPVRTLEDLQKLEIGAFSKSGVTYSELLGATPRNIKLEDIYVSLQRKAIDGIWFPTAPLIKWKMTDHTSNHSLVGGPFVMIPMTMSQETWDSLTDEQRAIFRSMENELTNFTGAIVDNRRGSSVAKMEARGDAIIRLSPEEKAKWVAQTKPAYDAWLALMEEKGNDGPAILARVQEFTAEFKGMDYTSAEWWGDSWQE
ncbi:MAG: TRAP transporter substrate-binding protein DctP [Boseongicola sp.]|nr:TRAP transporter substrate-binding protein DctP [Boseongicola sp.]